MRLQRPVKRGFTTVLLFICLVGFSHFSTISSVDARAVSQGRNSIHQPPQGVSAESWGDILNQIAIDAYDPAAKYRPPKLVKKVMPELRYASEAFGISVAVG